LNIILPGFFNVTPHYSSSINASPLISPSYIKRGGGS
jgi:hypothetical protein